MLPKWQVLLSFGSSRCQKVCLKAGIQDWGSPVTTIDKSRVTERFQILYFSYFRSFRRWVQHQQWQTSICMFFLYVPKTDFEVISDKCRCHQTLLSGKITPMTSRNVQQQLSLGWRLKSLARLLKVEAKVCANLEQDNQQCVLFAVLHPPNGLYRPQGIWAHATDRISMKLCQVLVHVVLRVSLSKHLLWGYGVVFIKSKSSACLLEHGRNMFGEKMYPFRSTTKSYPCVATDISSELPLNA